MRFERRSISKGISNLVSARRNLWSPKPLGFRILNYHTVGGHAYRDDRELFTISMRRFLEHLEYIVDEGFCLWPVSQMDCEFNSFKLGITFDDGYLDNLELVAPIMYERRIPFSVFITTDFLKKDARFMSPSQLVELSKFPNVSIGSHGKTHKSLTECSPSEVRKELFDSKAYLEDLLGKNIEMLAYPHGLVNLSVKQQVELAGYKKGFTTKFCINKHGVDPMMIGRYNIESDNTVKILSQKIYGDWDWYQFRSSALFSSIRT